MSVKWINWTQTNLYYLCGPIIIYYYEPTTKFVDLQHKTLAVIDH